MYGRNSFGASHDDLGNLLGMLRTRAKPRLSQLSLARLIGVSEKSIMHWENGTSIPHAMHLKKLIAVYLQLGVFTSGNEQVEAKRLWEKADLNAAFDEAWFMQTKSERGILTGEHGEAIGVSEPRQVEQDQSVNPEETGHTSKSNLPVPLTPILGRVQETATICRLLRRPGVRLLTLTGVGGVGKTRLGLQVATELMGDFADGVYLARCATLSDSNLVIPTIAQTLGLQEAGNRTQLESLQAHLRKKNLLLFIDNFEQVVAAAPQLSELLSACPDLKILVTSRADLHILGEQEFQVAPLALPQMQNLKEGEDLLQYPGIALFLERAQAVKPDFQMTMANAGVIVKICRRVDGLPLAIELAAARIKTLPPQALLAHLEKHRLAVLTSGPMDVPTRHQTLRDTIAWSYHLLDVREQRLFCRLCVFVGGCTLSAVEAVCAALDGEATYVLDKVESLINKSLLQQTEQEGEEPRFQILETIREYGLECLKANGGMEATQLCHATYFLNLAEKAEQELGGFHQSMWLEQLERDHDNLRAAMRWALEQGEVGDVGQRTQLALRLGASLHRFWLIHGHWNEGRTYLEQALLSSEKSVTSIRARAIYATASLALAQSDLDRAVLLGEESLGLFRGLNDNRGTAISLHLLGKIARRKGNFTEARTLNDEALALWRKVDDKWGIISLLDTSASVALEQGDYTRARTLFEESLAFWKEIGNKEGTAYTLWLLARVFLYQGDYITAHSLLEESLDLSRDVGNKGSIANAQLLLGFVAFFRGEVVTSQNLFAESGVLFREVGDRRGAAVGIYGLGMVAQSQANYAAASAAFEESLKMLVELDSKWFIVLCVEGLASAVALQGQSAWAVRLWGAAKSMREIIGSPMPPILRTRYEQAVNIARSDIGEEDFAIAWAEGQAMTLEQVLASRGHPASLITPLKTHPSVSQVRPATPNTDE